MVFYKPIYYVSLQRFNVGDIVKASNLSECGFVEKIERHYIIAKDEFIFIYYIRMFHDSLLHIWYYEDTLSKVS
jgi:hypothetical protein